VQQSRKTSLHRDGSSDPLHEGKAKRYAVFVNTTLQIFSAVKITSLFSGL
jgi:hypothetical protein